MCELVSTGVCLNVLFVIQRNIEQMICDTRLYSHTGSFIVLLLRQIGWQHTAWLKVRDEKYCLMGTSGIKNVMKSEQLL